MTLISKWRAAAAAGWIFGLVVLGVLLRRAIWDQSPSQVQPRQIASQGNISAASKHEFKPKAAPSQTNAFNSSTEDRSVVWQRLQQSLSVAEPGLWLSNFREALGYLLSCRGLEQQAVWSTILTAIHDNLRPEEFAEILKQNYTDLKKITDGKRLETRESILNCLLDQMVTKYVQTNKMADCRGLIDDSKGSAFGTDLCGKLVGIQVVNDYPKNLSLLSTISDTNLRTATEEEVLRNLEVSNRAQALAFYLRADSTVTTENVTAKNIFNVNWFKENEEEVSTVIRDSPPSIRRDQAIVSMLKVLGNSDVELTQAWLGAITDQGQRSAMEKALKAKVPK
jgi:hypothetical protein